MKILQLIPHMNCTNHKIIFSLLLLIVVIVPTAEAQKFRHVARTVPAEPESTGLQKSVIPGKDSILYQPRPADEIINSIPLGDPRNGGYFALRFPRIFYSFRPLTGKIFSVSPTKLEAVYPSSPAVDTLASADALEDAIPTPEEDTVPLRMLYPVMFGEVVPAWLSENIRSRNMMTDVLYSRMIENPSFIEYSYWKLPEPPRLPDDDQSFGAYLRSLNLPLSQNNDEDFQIHETTPIHWLHTFKTGIQFSQAYISPNWYQGGNNHLALLVDFLWDVALNQVYHPNLLFQNTISYKLGLNSTPQDKYHKYAISEDLFQWNLKFGVKAFRKWFYSFTAQFKTQFLNNYPQDSRTRTASFLSPGDLNMGLGMTYSIARKSLKFNASISPISYNLKTCIDRMVDPMQFNIPAGRKLQNEIGSNAELTLEWKWARNIVYKSRLFLFSNYKYFQGDWENTISFNINRFLSTQIYVHARYDTSSEISDQKWKHFMLKEILSFGFSYALSTK